MQKISPFLWFNDQAEEAMLLYTSIFKNSKVLNVSRLPGEAPGISGKAISVMFELEGQEFLALNAGPQFSFTPAISFFVKCKDQAEVDDLWDKLIAGGGSPEPCGWLKDKFGVSWQIIPNALGELMGDPDPIKAQRVMQAMLQMKKIEVAKLQAAYDGQ